MRLAAFLIGLFNYLVAPAYGWTPPEVATRPHRRPSLRLLMATGVVVVGGGVGGLAVAARIAAVGAVNVTLLEKNNVVGGRCGSFYTTTANGQTFRHERGPSLLLLPHVYQRLFTDCGTTAADLGLELRPCVPAYQVIFDDGDRINLGFPRDQSLSEELSQQQQASRDAMNRFDGPGGAERWDQYMRITSAYLDSGLPNFIEERLDLASLPSFVVEALRDWGQAWPLQPHSDLLDKLFVSDKMKALASFQDLYVGLEP